MLLFASVLVIAVVASACGASSQSDVQAPGQKTCETQCEVEGRSCDASCTKHADDTEACANRCGATRATCLSACR